jgi:hypothetical protein
MTTYKHLNEKPNLRVAAKAAIDDNLYTLYVLVPTGHKSPYRKTGYCSAVKLIGYDIHHTALSLNNVYRRV